MADLTNIKTGDMVSFELETSLLQSEYSNVKVLGVVSHTIAMTVEDVSAIHANILATLPDGTPVNAEALEYLLVQLPSGERKALGVDWIKDPINTVSSNTVKVVVTNAGISDMPVIRKALSAYGYSDVEMELV